MSHFFQPDIQSHPFLEGEEFIHCTKVLRKKSGDEIDILDGKGLCYHVTIGKIEKRKCELVIVSTEEIPPKPFHIHLAIAPTKSLDRMEWMVEKTGELGIDEITFLRTDNSERPKINLSRLEKKAISSLKQSKNGYLIKLNLLIRFSDFIQQYSSEDKFMAVVEKGLPYFSTLLKPETSCRILIGPEGDFTLSEQTAAIENGYHKISLGRSVLRTETAGLMACHFVNVANAY